jgi:hypothetical protein
MLLQSAGAPAAVWTWTVMAGVALSALPTLAVWSVGRLDRRDPIGQVGIAWGLMFCASITQLVLMTFDRRREALALTPAVLVALPLLIVPPLLTWIGPRAARWRLPVQAAFATWSLLVYLALGTGREGRLALRCTAYASVAVLAAWAMAAQTRRASQGEDAGTESGGPWIGAGHVLYFLTSAVGNALIEALVSRWPLLIQAYRAQHLLYGVAMCAIAWGIWVGARAPAASRLAPPGRRFPAPPSAPSSSSRR